MGNNYSQKFCPNCGKPTELDVCPFCYFSTKKDLIDEKMDYPVMDCIKMGKQPFWGAGAILSVVVYFYFWIMLISFFGANVGDLGFIIFAGCLVFCGVGVLFSITEPLRKNLMMKYRGVEFDATVCEYTDDRIYIYGKACQIVKLLVNTNEGLKFLFCPIELGSRSYAVNSKVKLKFYKKFYILLDDNK